VDGRGDDAIDRIEPGGAAPDDAEEAEALAALQDTLDDEPDDEDEGDGDTASVDDLGLPMPVLPESIALELLTRGELSIVGRLWASTNNALLCLATLPCPDPEPDLVAACIYKPVMGERPLDDFPDGTLARREVAAFAVSQASGWGIVPPTVLRDGPFGEGMVQLWIRVDETVDPVGLVIDEDERLRRVAVFDAAVNNTDRKAGHLLPVPGGHVYGVDHGVTFSPVPKLRTVLWAWRGMPLRDDELEVLRTLRACLDDELGDRLRPLLAPIEVATTARRIDRLIEAGVFPQPDPRRPALPWPPV
jgi:uncharacterized repeat protein (TIGR03843 family)